MKLNNKRSIITMVACGAFALAAVAQNAGSGNTGAAGTGTGTATTDAGSQRNLETLFKALDTNSDASVSREEFMRGTTALNAYQGSRSGTPGTGTGATGGTGGTGTGGTGTGTGGTGGTPR